MKYRNKWTMKAIIVLLLAALFIFVGQVNGEEEEYDEDTYGPADPIIWIKPVKAVVFLHKFHTMEAGLECDSCHNGEMFEMAAGTAEENDDFTMASLYEGKYCGACHDGETAFASNTRCTTCHIGVKGYNRLTGVGGKASSGEHH